MKPSQCDDQRDDLSDDLSDDQRDGKPVFTQSPPSVQRNGKSEWR